MIEDCPRIATLLESVERNRIDRLSIYGSGATLRGIDEALRYLIEAESDFEKNAELRPLKQLVARAVAELETAVYAFICGFHAVLFDSMRAAMEVEFLLRDFLLWPPHLSEWFDLPARERYKKFKPAKLRERYRKWSEEPSTGSQESKDYSMHSEHLHVNPTESHIDHSGLNDVNEPGQLRVCLAEITSHTGKLIILVHRHMNGLPMDVQLTKETAPTLPLFDDAWSRSRMGVAMWLPSSSASS